MMKKAGCALAVVAVGWLAWMAAGTRKGLVADAVSAAPAPSPAAVTLTTGSVAGSTAKAAPPLSADAGQQAGFPRRLLIPVAGYAAGSLRDMFDEVRGGNRRHEAIDLMAVRGTAVIAADEGVVKKLFTSNAGGLTVYQFDRDERYCYYYAHLDGYAAGLHEGQQLRRGELVGYVGTTGNAPKDAPHLHFAVIRLDPDKRWWKGTYIDPYPLFDRPQ